MVSYCCCRSVTKLCQTLCNPMDYNTPGCPVLHYLPEFAKSCLLSQWCLYNHLILCDLLFLLPLVFPSIRVFSNELALRIRWPKYGASVSASVLNIHWKGQFPLGLTGGASVSASVLNIHWKGQFPLGLTGLISLQSQELSRVFSSTTVQKHQFFSA